MLRKCHVEPAAAANPPPADGAGRAPPPRSLAPLGMTGRQLFSWSVVPVARGMNDSGAFRNPCENQTYECRSKARVSEFPFGGRAGTTMLVQRIISLSKIRDGSWFFRWVDGNGIRSCREAISLSSTSLGQAGSRMSTVLVERSQRPFEIDSTNFPARKFLGRRRSRLGSLQQDNGRRTGSARAHR